MCQVVRTGTIGAMKQSSEASYPISFRKREATTLGDHLRHHNSVVIIGMKRVGISNFLRFFLHHQEVPTTYIRNGAQLLTVIVDLNDLVEREIYPFWVLLLKRIVDTLEQSKVPGELKKAGQRLFTESIQLKDLFFTVDCVQKLLGQLIDHGFYPTVFLLRFDRLSEVITPEFFGNLQRLKDAAQQRLSFIFTSFRPLYELRPDVFSKSSLSVFSRDLYMTPALATDMTTILNTLQSRYNLNLPKAVVENLVSLSGGHVQYLHLALLVAKKLRKQPETREELLELLLKDEEIVLQSEELFASLTKVEQEVILKHHRGLPFSQELQEKGRYLWETGMISSGKKEIIFSPLFENYLHRIDTPVHGGTEFTKKEHLLFSFLKTHEGILCEREDIVSAVWPETAEMGISDWAIDRLVARVRGKLKAQKSSYGITTVITRGYKLVRTS